MAQGNNSDGGGECQGGSTIGQGVFRSKPVTYAVVDGLAIFEGDIVLGTPEELQSIPHPSELAVGIVGDQFRWPKGIIPYTIASGLDPTRVNAAIQHWEAKTVIRFVLRTAANQTAFPDYVTFQSGDGNSSSIGRRKVGQQFITLGGTWTTGNAIHEIGHTVGLWHEHSRGDRNSFVTVNVGNIRERKEHNFYQHINDGAEVVPYDYGSLMHYGTTFFSKNDQPTIVARGGQAIGQRVGLSDNDVAGVQDLYPVWVDIPGAAEAITIGADGSVWAIGNAPGGSIGIIKWNGTGWISVDGAATHIAVSTDGTPWIVNINQQIYRRQGQTWVNLPGAANDIGAGGDGSVWVIGTNAQSGGYGIFKWNGSGWDEMGGAAVRIAVGPDGTPWVVSDSGAIYRRSGQGWVQLPGTASDIAVGADGSVWIIGTNAVNGGFGIFAWTGYEWVAVDGGATHIAVGLDGLPWIIKADSSIFRRGVQVSPSWVQLPGAATDIGVGGDGSVWVTGALAAPGGYGIFKWNGTSWDQVQGGAWRIAVDAAGVPWIANRAGILYRSQGTSWLEVPCPDGGAFDVGIGGGATWIVSRYNAGLYTMSGGAWRLVNCPRWAYRIAVGGDGTPWMVDSVGGIHHQNGGVWTTLPGTANDIGVGTDGTVWVVGTNAVGGGYGIRKWNGTGWVPVDGGAINLSVGPDGMPWIVNSAGNIYERIKQA